MGMAALAMTQIGGGFVDYQAIPIGELRELARQQHPEHTDEAARAFVQRILEMEVERRTLYGDEHLQGYAASAIAPGSAPGGTAIAREPLAALYDRGIRYHEAHEAARRWIAAARLPPRQLLAVLLQARKLHPRNADHDWTRSYDQIAAAGPHYAHLMGWPREFGRGLYKNGQAVKDAAKAAKVSLILMAKV